jgi:hybrid cluster-associated redox disulfide protein
VLGEGRFVIGIAPTLTVGEVLDRWPTTARVFVRRSMACVGCAMSAFDTLGEAAAVYGVVLHTLLKELREASRADVGSWRPAED